MCFLVWKSALCYEKRALCHENLLKVLKVSKILLFVKSNLINRFGKENSQFTKNIREKQNWSYQKMFCIILSNFWFLCFLVWKSAFVMKRVLDVMKICLKSWKSPKSIVLLNWTWLTVLERKTPNSPKIYVKHKIG